MKRLSVARSPVVLCTWLVLVASASATTITLSVDGETQQVPVHYVPDESGGQFHIGTPGNPEYRFENDDAMVELEGALDPDPSIMFAAAVADFGSPSIFGFTFIMPLAPPFPNPSVVFDSLSAAVTNGPTAGGVTVTAMPPPAGIPVDGDGIPELQVYTLSDDGGLTWKNVGLDAGPTTTVPLGSFASGHYGTFNQGPIPTIAGGPWTHMRADLNFGLSGDGDSFAFTGAKVLVPEPGALLLLALGSILPAMRPRARN